MMTITPEVAAAAERRSRRKSESFEKVYGMDYWLSDRDDAALIDFALSLIARHADDGEAIDEAWLRSIGAVDNPIREKLEIGPAQWYRFHSGDVLGIDHYTGFYELKTRGELRRLCDALKITTKA